MTTSTEPGYVETVRYKQEHYIRVGETRHAYSNEAQARGFLDLMFAAALAETTTFKGAISWGVYTDVPADYFDEVVLAYDVGDAHGLTGYNWSRLVVEWDLDRRRRYLLVQKSTIDSSFWMASCDSLQQCLDTWQDDADDWEIDVIHDLQEQKPVHFELETIIRRVDRPDAG